VWLFLSFGDLFLLGGGQGASNQPSAWSTAPTPPPKSPTFFPTPTQKNALTQPPNRPQTAPPPAHTLPPKPTSQTNHLDLEASLWLGCHLTGPACAGLTVVVVSHDRAFLDAVTEETILFKDRQLRWGGLCDSIRFHGFGAREREGRLDGGVEWFSEGVDGRGAGCR
jgi:hypothetical protein